MCSGSKFETSLAEKLEKPKLFVAVALGILTWNYLYIHT